MTATPPPVPPDPAGPPTSGTFESSTPTPQQLAGTKSEKALTSRTVRYSGKIHWRVKAKVDARISLARVSLTRGIMILAESA